MMRSLTFFASLILVSLLQQSSKAIHSEGKGFIARSCLDYLRADIFESDFYRLSDSNGIYMAYCDLSSEPGAAWTLVMSWNQASKDLPHFRSKPLLQDAPINQKTPNWNSYRQTLARIQTLRSQSTYWRATCSFDQMQQKIDYRDYLRGKFSDFDIMTYVGHGVCKPVDYVNVRGHSAGSGTTTRFWQVPNLFILHMDSSDPGSCSFNPSTGAVPSEDNFGYYSSTNKNFRCTMTNDSTTQWWFGGYLDEL